MTTPIAPYRAFGLRLQALRREAHLYQTELAKLADVSHSYPSALERGQYQPDAAVLRRLVAVLRTHGAPADYDELAGLARYPGYRPPPAALLEVDAAPKLAVLRRLASLPLVALERLENVARAIGLEAVAELSAGADGPAVPLLLYPEADSPASTG